MDRARDMEILVSAIDLGGFTAAAEALGLTPSAVSKGMTRLETRLGVRLLERTTRRISLTSEGQRYYEAAKRVLADIDEAEAAAQEGRGRPTGLLRIASGVAFSIAHLAPALPDFAARYPDIDIELGVADRRVDILAENWDVGVRTGPVGDERLVGRKLAEIERVICGSPAYLARHGVPQTPDDLARHTRIALNNAPMLALWPFREGDGVRRVEMRARVVVDDASAVLALGLAGLGLIRLGDFVVGPHIRSGALAPVMTDRHIAEPVPINLVFAPGRPRLPKVRVFLDFMTERFGHSPWRV